MKHNTTFSFIGAVEIETENDSNEIVSVKYKDKMFHIGDLVVCKKRVRGFKEGTRGIIVSFWKKHMYNTNFIEVHFENHHRSHTMKLREIYKSTET